MVCNGLADFKVLRTVACRPLPLPAVAYRHLPLTTASWQVPRSAFVYYAKAMIAPIALIVLMQCFFAAVFTSIEPWSFWAAFYHCMVTATTVG